MPWITIVITLLTFFMSKRSGASSTKAALVAGLAGAGSYYVTHETDWGKANLGDLDGVAAVDPNAPPPKVDGQPVGPTTGGVLTGLGTGVKDVLTSWGGTGTAAVVGTAAIATNSDLQKYLPWVLIAGAALLIMK